MRSGFGLIMFAWCCALNAQNPDKRMDPEDWMALTEVQESLTWAKEMEGAYALQLRTPRGWMYMPARSQGQWWVREGDLRLVLDQTGKNASKSHNIGFNLGCYHFTTSVGRQMSLGGLGFWEMHAKCIEFMSSSGEWELVSSSEGPAHVNMNGCWLTGPEDEVLCLTKPSGTTWEAVESAVWIYDASEAEWRMKGALNPKLSLFWGRINGGGTYELGEYVVWPRLHQTVLIRKADEAVVVHPDWRKDMVREWARRKPSEHSVLVSQGETTLQMWTWSDEEGEALGLNWDVKAAFDSLEALHGTQALVVPAAPIVSDDVSADQNASLPLPIWPWLLGLGLGSVGFWMGRKRKDDASKASADSAQTDGEKGASENQGARTNSVSDSMAAPSEDSKDVQVLEALGEVKWRTEEFNEHLGLGSDLSEESKRARRAQFIRDLNREYQLKHGTDLICREKDPEDRRRTYYIIRPR